MSNYASGHKAEEIAEKYLRNLGYKIVALNWKTRLCEIDIIAQLKDRLHFVEVKHRQTSVQGTGFDYITPQKLKQMRFSAEMWVSENGWDGEYVLAAIELSGPNCQVTNFLPVLEY